MWRRALDPLLRRALLAYAVRAPVERQLEKSRIAALEVARWAAKGSPAYAALVDEAGLTAALRAGRVSLAQLPVLGKANTFGRFPLDRLMRPLEAGELADVLTSSGRSGKHFGFRLATRRQLERSAFAIDLGLQHAFDVDRRPTLLVNCLPMGVVFRSDAVTVANVSVREDMACAILRDVGPRFDQSIICTDPLFVRRLIDEAKRVGVDWKALNTSVILGEEMLVEAQREYVAARLNIEPDSTDRRMVGSSFGVGELGLNLLFESRETIRMLRVAQRDPSLLASLCGVTASVDPAGLFCYSPHRLHLEVLSPDGSGFGELCFTMLGRDAVIPLPRFASGDVGRLVSGPECEALAGAAGVRCPRLPLVLLRGRAADRATGWPSVEAVKSALYANHEDADRLTGAFRVRRSGAGAPEIIVQGSDAAAASDAALAQRLTDRLSGRGTPAQLSIVAPQEFPGLPILDFERKLNYFER